jgi:hypothetical protein
MNILENQTQLLSGNNEVLKATALLYLSEALQSEEYETCAELVAIAKGFGASQGDISAVIAELNTGLKTGVRIEAKSKKKGRL